MWHDNYDKSQVYNSNKFSVQYTYIPLCILVRKMPPFCCFIESFSMSGLSMINPVDEVFLGIAAPDMAPNES